MPSSSNAGSFKYLNATSGTTVAVGGVTAMSASINIASIDLTAMHATNRHRVFGAGKYQGTFSVELLLDYSEHETVHGLTTSYKNGTEGQAELVWGGTAGTLAGLCFITGLDFGATMDGVSTLTVTGRFSGTITY